MSYSDREWEVWTKEYVSSLVERDWAAEGTGTSGYRRFINLMEGNSILDVACGVGHCIHALPSGIKYLGIDTSTAMLYHARKRFPEHRFHFGDVYDLKNIPQVHYYSTYLRYVLLFFRCGVKQRSAYYLILICFPIKGKRYLWKLLLLVGLCINILKENVRFGISLLMMNYMISY